MGLACSQIRLLTLTRRKSDCEYNISVNSMEEMAITREQSELSKEYYSKLQAKQISYYENGQYNKMNYNYLMGSPSTYSNLICGNTSGLKTENSMILCDYKGQVVLSDSYAKAITDVLGTSVMDCYGRGSTFSTSNIAKIIANMTNLKEEDIQAAIDEEGFTSSINTTGVSALTGETTGNNTTKDSSDSTASMYESIVDFYYPIFAGAAANGWTTEYNKDMAANEDYISDALVSGSFQLEEVDSAGEYDEGTSLTYFITAGLVQSRTDSDTREEITAWYNAEKERISEKESYLNLEQEDLSTELESINTEIQSIQSLIDDAISSVFDWGSS